MQLYYQQLAGYLHTQLFHMCIWPPMALVARWLPSCN